MNQPFDIDSGKISQLPFTLSYPIEQAVTAIEKQQYGKAMNHLIDFFEISAPFCSFVFLRLLQQASTNNAAILPALRQFVDKIDNKRPLSFGDWLNDLLTPLIAAAAKHMPQSSLTKSFCDNIYIKRRNILLGSKHRQASFSCATSIAATALRFLRKSTDKWWNSSFRALRACSMPLCHSPIAPM